MQATQKEIARFWSHVVRSDGCWLWKAATDRDGYGWFKFRGRMIYAHRFALMLKLGVLTRWALHTCDTPGCVRDEHLYEGTAMQNSRDAQIRNRLAKGDRNGSRKFPERLKRGEENSASKLTGSKVRFIRRAFANGTKQVELAAEFGVTNQLISAIVNQKIWTHV